MADTTTVPAQGVKTSNVPGFANPPLPMDGNGYFSNYQLAALVLGIPYLVKRSIPYFSTGLKTYIFLVLVLGLPITIAYWTLMSTYGPRKNEKVIPPGRDVSHYLDIKDVELKREHEGKNKINMQVFHDAFFDGKIDVKGDMLDVLEYRHDWAKFNFTPELFKYVLTQMLPEVIMHSKSQDEEQVRDHYDRGDDFYEWFLGPRMIYTSGVVRDITREETLEELQDNKLALVCEKLDLKPGEKLLDIGCGWGTLAAYAAKNFGVDATGITLGKNQTKFGNQRIKDNGVSPEQARILCMDYREIPRTPGTYNKIVSLEMAEHVGIRRYQSFLRQVYDLLDDDGIFVLQVAGIRPHWQYEDLIWGLFMNKYVFPGADASCALNWVIGQVEAAGFEVKEIDVLGVHYSATIFRWYKNWLSNKEKLASSTITSRQGGASVFQITLHKNINGFHRINGVPSHPGIVTKKPVSEYSSIL